MFREHNDIVFSRSSSLLVILLMIATLATVVFQDFEAPVTAQKADTEQSDEDHNRSHELDLTVWKAVTSSVDLSVGSQYFLIDVVPIPGSNISFPRIDDVPLDAGLKLSRILFRRIISPNAP